jgi:hypothetical protein
MKQPIEGCGKGDGRLTLFRIVDVDGVPPIALTGYFWQVPCGYRTPRGKLRGILLCDECVTKFGLPPLAQTAP